MSELSLMILCGRSPRHIYFANRLCEARRPVAIVQEKGREWTAKKVIQQLRSPVRLWRKLWRRARARWSTSMINEAVFFFGDRMPSLDRPEVLVQVPHINHPDVLALAKHHEPDVIAVFGTSLIRGGLLGCGRIGIINLHGGLSPEYRGADCTFWALYNGEPEKVGCTLHTIDAGIDTGRLIAHVCPELRPTDDELTLFWKGVRDSTEAFSELLSRLAKGERFGQKQTSRGRLYQFKDRTARHERRLQRLLKEGLLKDIDLPKRVSWFTQGDIS